MLKLLLSVCVMVWGIGCASATNILSYPDQDIEEDGFHSNTIGILETLGISRSTMDVHETIQSSYYFIYSMLEPELKVRQPIKLNMALELSIEPKGNVSTCYVVKGDLDSRLLSRKLCNALKEINFGLKPNATTLNVRYPIQFSYVGR